MIFYPNIQLRRIIDQFSPFEVAFFQLGQEEKANNSSFLTTKSSGYQLTKHDHVNSANNRIWNCDKHGTELVKNTQYNHNTGSSLNHSSTSHLKIIAESCVNVLTKPLPMNRQIYSNWEANEDGVLQNTKASACRSFMVKNCRICLR